MTVNNEEQLRDALRGAIRHHTDGSLIVRTETRLAARQSPALATQVITTGLPTTGRHLTRQDANGHTIHTCICGINRAGDGSVCG